MAVAFGNPWVNAMNPYVIYAGDTLKRLSRQVVFLNTSPPEERVYLLKSNLDLLADDADIAASNVIARYVTRAPELEMSVLLTRLCSTSR